LQHTLFSFSFVGIKYYICRPTHWIRFQLYNWW